MVNDEWSALHSGVEIKGFVKYWILISKYLAKPFIWLRISPNQISVLSIFFSVPFIFYPYSWWIVLIALVLDGIDGRVAIATKKATKYGAVVDSISDRIIELIWGLGLFMLGLNLIPIFLFIGMGWIQEYIRARAGGLGYKGIGVVTISERPTRAIFISLISLLGTWSTLILWIAFIVQLIGLITLIIVLEKDIN